MASITIPILSGILSITNPLWWDKWGSATFQEGDRVIIRRIPDPHKDDPAALGWINSTAVVVDVTGDLSNQTGATKRRWKSHRYVLRLDYAGDTYTKPIKNKWKRTFKIHKKRYDVGELVWAGKEGEELYAAVVTGYIPRSNRIKRCFDRYTVMKGDVLRENRAGVAPGPKCYAKDMRPRRAGTPVPAAQTSAPAAQAPTTAPASTAQVPTAQAPSSAGNPQCHQQPPQGYYQAPPTAFQPRSTPAAEDGLSTGMFALILAIMALAATIGAVGICFCARNGQDEERDSLGV